MQPELKEIQRLREHGNVIPVYKSVIADFLTPVSLFSNLRRIAPMHFFSKALREAKHWLDTLSLDAIPFWCADTARSQPAAEFMQNLRTTLGRFKSVTIPNLPPFTGGAVGYFGYDMVRTIEDIPDTVRDDLGVDDAVLMFYKTVLAFDHLRHQIHIISNLLVDESKEPLDVQYAQATEEIHRIESILRTSIEPPVPTTSTEELVVRSNFEKNDYLNAVTKAKEYIAAGDIFQVVLAQRFEGRPQDFTVRGLSSPSDCEPLALHVLSEDARHVDRRIVSGNARADSGERRVLQAHRRNSAARRK
jgi:anthranilate synthase component 1